MATASISRRVPLKPLFPYPYIPGSRAMQQCSKFVSLPSRHLACMYYWPVSRSKIIRYVPITAADRAQLRGILVVPRYPACVCKLRRPGLANRRTTPEGLGKQCAVPTSTRSNQLPHRMYGVMLVSFLVRDEKSSSAYPISSHLISSHMHPRNNPTNPNSSVLGILPLAVWQEFYIPRATCRHCRFCAAAHALYSDNSSLGNWSCAITPCHWRPRGCSLRRHPPPITALVPSYHATTVSRLSWWERAQRLGTEIFFLRICICLVGYI